MAIEILDSAGSRVRRYSSADPTPAVDLRTLTVPPYWVRPAQVLSTAAGMHRFLWDLHYTPLPAGQPNYPISAIYMNTAPGLNSPWVPPGQYAVRLTVEGKSYTQPLTVKMDPRVKTPVPGITQQSMLSKALYDGVLQAQSTLQQLRSLRAQLNAIPQGAVLDAIQAFDTKAAALEGSAGGQRGGEPGRDTLSTIGGTLTPLLAMLQASDDAPTTQLAAAVAERRRALESLVSRWNSLKGIDLTNLNSKLLQAGLAPLKP